MASTDINGEPILILTLGEAKNLFDALIRPLDTDTIDLFYKTQQFLKEVECIQ